MKRHLTLLEMGVSLLFLISVVVSSTPTGIEKMVWRKSEYFGSGWTLGCVLNPKKDSSQCLGRPTIIAYLNDKIFVNDYNNNRTIIWKTDEQMFSSSQPWITLQSQDINSAGNHIYLSVVAYDKGGEEYVWLGNLGLKRFEKYVGPFYQNMASNPPIVVIPSNDPTSILEDPTDSQYVYVTEWFYNRVLKYRLSNLTEPVAIYGQNNMSDIRPNKGLPGPNNSTLWNPILTTAGCNSDLWILDSSNIRLLHFSHNSTEADVVIGQLNFSSTSSNIGLGTSFSFIINQDCSRLWLGDNTNGYILAFHAPFVSGMSPNAQLSFGGPYGLSLDGDQQTLYISNGNAPLYSSITRGYTDVYNSNSTISHSSLPSESASTSPTTSPTTTPTPSPTPSQTPSPCAPNGLVGVWNGSIIWYLYQPPLFTQSFTPSAYYCMQDLYVDISNTDTYSDFIGSNISIEAIDYKYTEACKEFQSNALIWSGGNSFPTQWYWDYNYPGNVSLACGSVQIRNRVSFGPVRFVTVSPKLILFSSVLNSSQVREGGFYLIMNGNFTR